MEEENKVVENPELTNQEMPIEEANGTNEGSSNKKKIIKIIIAACIVAAIAIATFFVVKSLVKNGKIDTINNVVTEYEKNEINYEEATQKLDSFSDETDNEIISAVNTTKDKLTSVRGSTISYYSGIDLYNAGKYLDAAEKFKGVQSASMNYDDAQAKLKEIQEKCKSEVDVDLDSISDADCLAAAGKIQRYTNIYSDDQEMKDKEATCRKRNEAYQAEQEAKRKEAEREEAKSKFRVTGIWLSGPDSVDGYELHITHKNLSNKTINYVHFNAKIYNAIGDELTSGTGFYMLKGSLQDTGPWGPGQGHGNDGYYWGKFYDSTIRSVKLTGVSIEYSDGTTWTLNANEVDAVQY